ncbi:MAG: GNAT family N-acetyltransferase [Gammaproteobacteria bacterium]|nr:GNAT family N-acetyltransferase [Gammaproteobacteria bacterium]
MTTIYSRPSMAAVKNLLAAENLPTADITDTLLAHFFGYGDKSAPDGVIGFELHGNTALLRSLAVTAVQRGRGVGSRLVVHAEQYARANGIESLYLLTTTAEKFFRRRGYQPSARAAAPAGIRDTTEFSSLCPASAVLMVKNLVTTATDRALVG